MDTKKYKVIITPTAYREINQIYDYISEDLYAEKAAKRLMKKVEKQIEELKYTPELHSKIEKIDELNRTYRRIVVDNYVILYTVDKQENKVYVSHIYYGRQNYFDTYI